MVRVFTSSFLNSARYYFILFLQSYGVGKKERIAVLTTRIAAQLQASLPHVQPEPAEVAEMARRANEVVRLLEELKRLSGSPSSSSLSSVAGMPNGRPPMEPVPMDVDSGVGTGGDGRAPKRPWEEMNADDEEVDELVRGAPFSSPQ